MREPIPFETLSSADQASGRADQIMEIGWSFANNHPVVKLDLPIDWTSLCMSDRTWNFKLHSWDFMGPVIQGYARTGERRYLDWCVDRAASWGRQFNTRDAQGTMAWYDMALGLRGHRLAFVVEQALMRGVDSKTMSVLLACVVRHRLEYLKDQSFSEESNHGLYVALGQLALARRLRALPRTDVLESEGRERLAMMVRAQFAPDGGHTEHSPDYHRMVVATLGAAGRAGLLHGDEVHCHIALAEEILGWFIQPNGEIVPVGDSPARQMRSQASRTSSSTTEFLVSRGARGTASRECLRVLRASGYAIVRSPQPIGTDDHDSSSYLLLAAGFHSRTHKQADDLTITWFDRGHEILIDAGRYGYVDLLPADSPLRSRGYFYGSPERRYVESTQAHNTVEVDGSDHVRLGRTPYGSGLRGVGERDGHFRLRAEVDHGSWRHHRQILFLPGRWLQVTDNLTAQDGTPHDYRVWWNFPEQLVPKPTEQGGLLIDVPELGDTLWVSELGRSSLITPVTAQREPLRGWRSKADMEFTPAWSTGFEAINVRDHQFRTLFSFGGRRPSDSFRTPFDDDL